MRDEVLKICAIAALSAVCGVVIGQIKKEMSFAVRVAGIILIFGVLFSAVGPFLADMQAIFSFEGVSEYIEAMIKALGVAFITHICATLCRDCGENGLASGVEFAGKLEILMLCAPLISKVIGYVSQMMSMGE